MTNQQAKRNSRLMERAGAGQEPKTDPVASKTIRLDWQTIALWSFVVFCFAALVFAGYVIWAKCHANSPF